MKYLLTDYQNNTYVYDTETGLCRYSFDVDESLTEVVTESLGNHLLKLKLMTGNKECSFHIISFSHGIFSFEVYLYVNTGAYQRNAHTVLFLRAYSVRTNFCMVSVPDGFRWGWYFASDKNLRLDKVIYGVLNVPVPVEFALSLFWDKECILEVFRNTYFIEFTNLSLFDLYKSSDSVLWYGFM